MEVWKEWEEVLGWEAPPLKLTDFPLSAVFCGAVGGVAHLLELRLERPTDGDLAPCLDCDLNEALPLSGVSVLGGLRPGRAGQSWLRAFSGVSFFLFPVLCCFWRR